MKKNLLFVMLMASVMLLSGCNKAQQSINYAKLKMGVEQVQKEMPEKVDGVGLMTKVELDETEKVVVYTCEVTNPEIDMNIFKKNEKYVKKNILRGIGQDSDSKELTDECIKSGVGVKFVYKGNGTTVTASVPFEELKAYVENPTVETPQELLQEMADMTKASLPETIDENTTMTDAYVEGNNFVMEFSFDEVAGTISDIDKSSAKKAIMGNIANMNDESTRQQCETCKKAQSNLVFRYVGAKTHKKLDITIPYTDL